MERWSTRGEHATYRKASLALTLQPTKWQPMTHGSQDTQDLEYADREDAELGYDREELSTQKKEVVKMKNRRS